MPLPLAYYGDPVLRKKAAPIDEITDEIRQLVRAMKETMEANDGCGLAAPQVHHSVALFITCIPRYVESENEDEEEKMIPGELRVFINPKIISYNDEIWACQEGCLSIPKLRETVERPAKVVIEATDLEGNRFTEEFHEFDAHVMMHENDHLNGVLYIDRLSLKRKKEIEAELKEIKKKYYKK
jgi:peptide deformylase